MVDPGIPTRQTTTVTSNTTVQTNIRFDPAYLKTLPGVLKCVQAVSDLLGFIFIQSSGSLAYHSTGSAYSTFSMFGFWCTLVLLGLYVFHFIEKFYKIPWLKFELVYCVVMTALFLIISILAVAFGNIFYEIAGVFGFISMTAYAIDAFLKYRAYRSGNLAQGERVVTKTTTGY